MVQYTYCLDNPIKYVDPLGLTAQTDATSSNSNESWVREYYEQQGYTVTWSAGSGQGSSTIVVTDKSGNPIQTMKEGTDYYINSDGKSMMTTPTVKTETTNTTAKTETTTKETKTKEEVDALSSVHDDLNNMKANEVIELASMYGVTAGRPTGRLDPKTEQTQVANLLRQELLAEIADRMATGGVEKSLAEFVMGKSIAEALADPARNNEQVRAARDMFSNTLQGKVVEENKEQGFFAILLSGVNTVLDFVDRVINYTGSFLLGTLVGIEEALGMNFGVYAEILPENINSLAYFSGRVAGNAATVLFGLLMMKGAISGGGLFALAETGVVGAGALEVATAVLGGVVVVNGTTRVIKNSGKLNSIINEMAGRNLPNGSAGGTGNQSLVGTTTSKGTKITRVSDHALDRINERGFTTEQIIDILVNPDATYPGNIPNTTCYQKNGFRIVVSDDGTIITSIILGK